MPVTLDQIVSATRRRVAESKKQSRSADLERAAEAHVPRGFRAALKRKAAEGVAIIAELKKASPSRGVIRAEFEVAQLSRDLQKAGATALSVLTDEEFFQGSLQNLRNASETVKIPCLRKDFIVDEFQLLEARASHADAVLLIVAALAQHELTALYEKARSLGLDVLCEVHDEQELERAADAGCDIVGVNNRDLRTFQVDLGTGCRLGEIVPAHALRVAESGIHSGADIDLLRSAGFEAFLIGESLMKAAKPGDALAALIASVRQPKTVS